MKCLRCGKEMVNTTGGNYQCTSCNMAVNDLLYRPSEWKSFPHEGFSEQKGWICPVCGRGVAPWVDYCPCQNNWNITYGTGTSIDNEELNRLFELNDKRVAEIIKFENTDLLESDVDGKNMER